MSRKHWLFLLKSVLVIFSVVFIYREIFIQHDIDLVLDYYATHELFSFPLLLSFSLVILNLSIEAFKWKEISRFAQKIPFSLSFKSILIGSSISIFTPNRVGEFGGKIILFEPKSRFRAFVLAIWSNFSQLLATILIGNIGIIYFLVAFKPWNLSDIFSASIITLSCLISVFAAVIFYNPIVLYLFLMRFKKIYKYKRNIVVLNSLKVKVLNKVLIYSILRYLTFSLQYWLLLNVFGANVPLVKGFMLITVVYYVITIVPTAALSDIGVRTTVAAFIFSMAGYNTIPVMIASVIIWFFNIAVPALTGIPFIIKTELK